MIAALSGHGFCRCPHGKGPREVASWALEEELEYWDRCLAEVGPESASAGVWRLFRDEAAAEVERRKPLRYARARKPFDLEPVIAAVKERADILTLFERHCERRQTINSLTPRSVKYRCFLHEDRDPSLVVWPDRGRWWCFSCGHGGDAIAAYMKLENVAFVPAVLALAAECGVAVPERPRRDGAIRMAR